MADKLDLFLTVCSDALKAEQDAMDRLTGKAEKYLATIGVILGFQAVKLQELSFSGPSVRVACSIGVLSGIGFLIAAMAVALVSMRVREYPTFPVTGELEKLALTANDDMAMSMTAKVYLALRDATLVVNEKRAALIKISGVILTIGLFLSVLGQLGLGLNFK